MRQLRCRLDRGLDDDRRWTVGGEMDAATDGGRRDGCGNRRRWSTASGRMDAAIDGGRQRAEDSAACGSGRAMAAGGAPGIFKCGQAEMVAGVGVGREREERERGNEYRSSGAEISVRSWGGQFGKPWNWRAESGITQISISHGDIIDSIVFKGHADEATPKRFGGKGGDRTDVIDIDYPYEYVTGISGTVGHFYDNGRVVTSLKINTNRCKYGHFGKEAGTPFSFNAENGVIVGFHGRADSYVNAIGVYLRKIMLPMDSDIAEIPLKQFDREYEIV
ncbi:Jacalin-related lectin 19 [Striga hermonthica]|uniref:Jacalin-related lectin 19 n=1 Tax=Striga hermonthica TaxID=68872 RepID=A0A9N7MRD2_STRHE|nr:Jacalin-related lectin 19 [Striga hermonthica]